MKVVEILFDRTITIRASVHDVEFELVLTVVLVVLVMFRFPAQRFGDGHSQRCRPAVADRDIRRHVPAGL